MDSIAPDLMMMMKMKFYCFYFCAVIIIILFTLVPSRAADIQIQTDFFHIYAEQRDSRYLK